MATIGELAVNVTANTKGFITNLAKGAQSVSKFAGKLPLIGQAARGARAAMQGVSIAARGMGAALSTAIGPFLKIVAPLLTVAAAYNALQSAFGETDRIAKFADQTGFATETLAGFRLGAKLTGTDVSTLENGIKRFSRVIGEARVQTGESRDALFALGFSLEEIKNLDAETLFKRAADNIRATADASDQADKAFGAFGRSGQELLNFLKLGSQNIGGFVGEAKELGVAFDREELRKVENFNDAVTRIGTAFKGAFQTAAVELAPFLESFAVSLTNAVKELPPLIRSWRPAFESAFNTINTVVTAGRVVFENFFVFLELGVNKAILKFLQLGGIIGELFKQVTSGDFSFDISKRRESFAEQQQKQFIEQLERRLQKAFDEAFQFRPPAAKVAPVEGTPEFYNDVAKATEEGTKKGVIALGKNPAILRGSAEANALITQQRLQARGIPAEQNQPKKEAALQRATQKELERQTAELKAIGKHLSTNAQTLLGFS